MDYSFIIRRAVAEDAPAVYTVLQKAFKEYAQAAGVKELEALNESISDVKHEINNKVIYIAVIDNIIIGTIRVEIINDIAYISRFAVDSSYRNLGVGKALMNLVNKYLQSEGVKSVSLYTASRYGALMRFYYGHGFYVESVSHDRGYPRARMVREY
ncbi:MAG TPA: GNAT family N-acetyltransferase [Thermoclostridium sp.]|nr:GNAT family N-acetyltransferase [Thermoclostridium sp.]